MFGKIKIAFLSAMLGFGTLAAMPASAQADSIVFSFGGNGARAGVYIDNGARYQRHHRRHYRKHHHRAPRYARTCSTRQAVHKATRMGLRHARITQANHRILRVSGRKGRYHESIVFARARHCPVIRYR